jgi:PqqD family protein of HPr-rel-A system
MKPRARHDGLLIRNLGSEVLVYDLHRHEAHCLNPSARAVFERCDGQTAMDALARALRAELGPEVDERWVGVALEQLDRARLLEPALSSEAHPLGSDRRTLLRHAGLTAALLWPAVVSMVAPTPAEAATCVEAEPIGVCPAGTPPGTPCYLFGSSPPCTLECQADGTCS